MAVQATNLQFDYSKYGFRDEEHYVFKSGKGLNEAVVRELSGMKGEPAWMLKRRLQALEIFRKKPVPLKGMWANEELAELDYENIHYFVRAGDKPQNDWDAVPAEIKNTFERLGIPEAERKFLAGVGAQYESEAVYSTNSLHSAVVEIIVNKGAKCRYTTIQNWSNNIFNLVTKRAVAYEEASMEWVDGNIGSRLTMKYPSVYLMGRGAKGEVLSGAYAGKGQHQDAGAKMIHVAPDTTSRITNKSVSKDGGKTTYRGLVKVAPGAINSKVNVNCDALILDEKSASDTIPFIEVEEEKTTLAHEATVGRIGAEQLFYLMSRGLKETDALSMIVLGFMEPFTRELPMEYAVELNRLIQLEMEGSVG